ncbi:PRC-barrel domain-containing protein [Bacillaceae bacterium Marseille-Q3522]|nr:PRC-barrel domain-containing protein [Bacillaceae bacterium Marseille-Q3522]
MQTFSLLKGQAIFDLSNGEKIGEVTDLVITDDGEVKGLVVKKAKLFNNAFFLKNKNIAFYGRDAVMIDDSNCLEPFRKTEAYCLQSQQPLHGKMMLTREGEQLGLLEDVYFLEELGTIVGYELSDGFFSDVLEGKRVVKTTEPPAIGKDAIIVNVK